jgi:hypothetical protein
MGRRGLFKKGTHKFVNFIRKGIANMRTDAISNMRVKVVVRDPETSMEKEKGLGKGKGKSKGKGRDKGKGKGSRGQRSTSMIVKNKKDIDKRMEKEAHY